MAQSLANILIHIIFSTKNRQPMIADEVSQELYSYIVGIARAHQTQVHEIGGIEDHLHLLISLPRTVTVSELVEDIKKGSSKWIKTKGSKYIDFSWQKGYGAFSIGQSAYENLRKYIKKQKEHHQVISFQDEYRNFLQKYIMSYDEKYLWD